MERKSAALLDHVGVALTENRFHVKHGELQPKLRSRKHRGAAHPQVRALRERIRSLLVVQCHPAGPDNNGGPPRGDGSANAAQFHVKLERTGATRP